MPTVTPAMAPEAATGSGWPMLIRYQARDNPTTSLLTASMTWDTAVGVMRAVPWA